MARVLILHPDWSARRHLETIVRKHHDVVSSSESGDALRAVTKFRPGLVVLGLTAHKPAALEFLRAPQGYGKLPAVIVASAEAAQFQPYAMKHGVKAWLESPVEPAELDQAISKALAAEYEAKGAQPPITQEEIDVNLTQLEADMNRRMKCFAGKNQVYLQSFIKGLGQTTKPRVALKCPLRKQFGEPPNVYYEYIRDVCCGDPTVCSAYQQFQARYTA